MPGMLASLGRSRSITRCEEMPPRCSSGLRLTNIRPWLTDAFQPVAPTEEPTPATAGSASTMSSARVCRSTIAW